MRTDLWILGIAALLMLALPMRANAMTCNTVNQTMLNICSNVTMAQNGISTIQGNIITMSNSLYHQSIWLQLLANNQTNTTTFNAAIARINANMIAIRTNLTAINTSVTSFHNQMPSSAYLSSIAKNSSTALSQSGQALSGIAGFTNVTNQNFVATNHNVSATKAFAVTTANTLNGNSNNGLNNDGILGIIAIIIAIVGTAFSHIRMSSMRKSIGNAMQQQPEDDVVDKMLHGEAEARVRQEVETRTAEKVRAKVKSQKNNANSEAQMSIDPEFRKLKAQFAKDYDEIKRSKAKINPEELESFKLLKIKMAQYGVNLKLNSDENGQQPTK